MKIRYMRIFRRVSAVPWAVRLERLAEWQAALSYLLQGERLDPEDVEALVGDKASALRVRLVGPEASLDLGDAHADQALSGELFAAGGAPRVAGRGQAIAVLGLKGAISHRIEDVDTSEGGTSTESFSKRFRSALNNPEIGGILLDVNSPGGNIHGVPELADEIRAARGQKPVVAVANAEMASAAYWLGSAAEELAVTPSGEVGSIGVWTMHQDLSAHLEQSGIKATLISAGKYKVEGNPFEALGEEARQALQASADEAYSWFVDAVAKSRKVTTKAVRDGFGEGRMVKARAAVREGMADRVATLDQELARMQRRIARGGAGGSRAFVGFDPARGNDRAAVALVGNGEVLNVLTPEEADQVFGRPMAESDEDTAADRAALDAANERARAVSDLVEADLPLHTHATGNDGGYLLEETFRQEIADVFAVPRHLLGAPATVKLGNPAASLRARVAAVYGEPNPESPIAYASVETHGSRAEVLDLRRGGVAVEGVVECNAGEGWLVRDVLDAEGKPQTDASGKEVLRETVFGRFEIRERNPGETPGGSSLAELYADQVRFML